MTDDHTALPVDDGGKPMTIMTNFGLYLPACLEVQHVQHVTKIEVGFAAVRRFKHLYFIFLYSINYDRY
jgi:hypothetical protein